MASGKGEGYVGQGLDVADILAVLLLAQMRYEPRTDQIDRLIFSAGHYSIGLWAALSEAGHLDGYDLTSYGADGSTLIMSTLDGHPPDRVHGRFPRARARCCGRPRGGYRSRDPRPGSSTSSATARRRRGRPGSRRCSLAERLDHLITWST